jgi:putative ABC transport system ATP-binding protein
MSSGLVAKNVGLAYFDGDRVTKALDDVSLDLPDRGFVGVMGPSGSGKSSLLYILSGLKRPTSGEVMLDGRALSGLRSRELSAIRRERFGFVFQQPWLLAWQTAAENALMGALRIDAESVARMKASFEELGISEHSHKMPSQLSGGEKQRLCVARAMMNSPSVIFADEPTAALDHVNGHLVVDLLARYRERGTVIVVTHDAEMLRDADRVLIMRDGRVVDWVSPVEANKPGPFSPG